MFDDGELTFITAQKHLDLQPQKYGSLSNSVDEEFEEGIKRLIVA